MGTIIGILIVFALFAVSLAIGVWGLKTAYKLTKNKK